MKKIYHLIFTLFLGAALLPGVTVGQSGCITVVESGGDAEGSTWSYTGGEIKPLTATNVNLNASDVLIKLALGNLSVNASCISVDANLTSTYSNTITFKATGNINIADAKSIATNGGAVTLWSDSDGDGTGYVQTGSSSSITTAGGTIVLGGGTDIATGYARGEATDDVITDPGGNFIYYISGIHLRNGTNLSSGGGNITLRGQNVGNSNSALQFGVMGHNAIVDAGSGKVAINGLAGGSGNGFSGTMNAQGISFYGDGWTIRSSNAGADAIVLDGDASTCNGSYTSMGINFVGTIESTGGGGIQMTGKSGTAFSYDHPMDIYGNVLSSSGPIAITAVNNVPSQTGLFLSTFLATATLGSKAGTNVLSSTSDIILKSDNTIFNTAIPINTSGTVSILPLDASTSFGVAQIIGSNMVLSAGVTSLTIGKNTNTSAVTISSPQSIAGPIFVYGGDIAINGTLTATDAINLHASGAVTQSNPIAANGLGLHGSGSFTLTNTSNAINTIAGGSDVNKIGSLNFTNSKALTVGSVNPIGIYSSGAIEMATQSGDLMIKEPIVSTLSSGDAVKLYADKDQVKGNIGDGQIKISDNGVITVESGSRALLYSGREDLSTGLKSEVGEINIRTQVDATTDLSQLGNPIGAAGKFALLRVFVCPGATEICGDGIDNNCNGQTDEGCVASCVFTTFSQGGWATKNNPLTTSSFGSNFSTGLNIGVPGKSIKLTSATAVKNFLPNSGTAARLTKDWTNPTNKQLKNTFAGQLVAMRLNMAYNPGLAEATIVSTDAYNGWTVQRLFDEANSKISSATPVSSSVLSSLSGACEKVNLSYHQGAVSGYVQCNPTSSSVKNNMTTLGITSTSVKVQTNSIGNHELSMDVFGNPTSNAFTIKVNSSKVQEVSMRVTDINGRVREVRSGLKNGQVVQFGSVFESGLYIVELTQEDKRVIQKLVKLK